MPGFIQHCKNKKKNISNIAAFQANLKVRSYLSLRSSTGLQIAQTDL